MVLQQCHPNSAGSLVIARGTEWGPHCFCLFFCVVGYPPNWGKWPRYIDRIYLYIQVISNGTRGQSCMNFQIGDSWVASSHPGVREPYLTTEYTLAAEASDKASAYLNFLIKNLGLCTSNSSNSKFRVCPCSNKYIFMKKLYINNTNHIKDVGNVYLSQHNIN